MSARPRTTSGRFRHLLSETRRSAAGAATIFGAIVLALGTIMGLSWMSGVTFGVSTAFILGIVLQVSHRIERQVRNSEDSAVISSLLAPRPPVLGTWAIEGDFGYLVVRELVNGRMSIVECGAGTTTLIVAACLQTHGSGRLYSLEHDPAYAAETMRQSRRWDWMNGSR